MKKIVYEYFKKVATDLYLSNYKVEELKKKKTEVINNKRYLLNLLSSGFSFVDKYKYNLTELATAPEVKELLDVLSTVKPIEKDRQSILKSVFLLNTIYENGNYNIKEREIQYQNAYKLFIDYENLFINKNVDIDKRLNLLSNSFNNKALETIEKVFKGPENDTKLNGNINLEEFNILIKLLDESNLSVEDKNDFVLELNQIISIYRKKKEIVKEKIANKTNITKLEDLTSKKVKKIKVPEDKKQDIYNYDRINSALATLVNNIDGTPEYDIIDEYTPLNRQRVNLYVDENNNINFSIILYDLINFINPDIIDEKYKNGSITKEEYDIVTNVIYKKIIRNVKNRFKSYQIDNKASYNEDVDEEELIDFKTTNEDVVSTSIKAIKEADELLKTDDGDSDEVNEEVKIDVKYLTEAEEIFIDEVEGRANQFEFNFRQKYPTNLYPLNILKVYLEHGDSDEIKAELIDIYVNKTERFKNALEQYISTYETIANDPSMMECISVLNEDKTELMEIARDLNNALDTYEVFVMGEEIENEKKEPIKSQHNFLILGQAIPRKSSDIGKNIKYSKLKIDDYIKEADKTYSVKKSVLSEGFKQLTSLFTISPKNYKKIKMRNKNLIAEFKPHRYRHSDLRYAYVNIDICEENKNELREKYNITTDEIRVLYIPVMSYKTDDNYIYEETEYVLSKDKDDIRFLREIFKEKFTDETRAIAYHVLGLGDQLLEKLGGEKENDKKLN